MNVELMKNKRKKLSLTQQQLADMCGISRVSISNYESGKAEPTMENLEKLSKALELDITELIETNIPKGLVDEDRKISKIMKIKLCDKISKYLEKDKTLNGIHFSYSDIYSLITNIEFYHGSYFGWSDYFKKVIVYYEFLEECFFVDFNKFIYSISSIILMIQRMYLIIFDENEKVLSKFENLLQLEKNFDIENKNNDKKEKNIITNINKYSKKTNNFEERAKMKVCFRFQEEIDEILKAINNGDYELADELLGNDEDDYEIIKFIEGDNNE